MVCVKWQHTIDFDIITFLTIWGTERNGSSESRRAMQSSILKTLSDWLMTGVSVSFVDKTNVRTYFPTVE
jgi:hypothetical protein